MHPLRCSGHFFHVIVRRSIGYWYIYQWYFHKGTLHCPHFVSKTSNHFKKHTTIASADYVTVQFAPQNQYRKRTWRKRLDTAVSVCNSVECRRVSISHGHQSMIYLHAATSELGTNPNTPANLTNWSCLLPVFIKIQFARFSEYLTTLAKGMLIRVVPGLSSVIVHLHHAAINPGKKKLEKDDMFVIDTGASYDLKEMRRNVTRWTDQRSEDSSWWWPGYRLPRQLNVAEQYANHCQEHLNTLTWIQWTFHGLLSQIDMSRNRFELILQKLNPLNSTYTTLYRNKNHSRTRKSKKCSA